MRKFSADFVYWSHVALVLFWWGLFLVPRSAWDDKITFHFYLTAGIVGHQFLWGALIVPWTKKYRMVCALTTLMQWLRGQSVADPQNYGHSFTKEFFRKNGITVSHRTVTAITFTVLVLVSVQYFFFNN